MAYDTDHFKQHAASDQATLETCPTWSTLSNVLKSRPTKRRRYLPMVRVVVPMGHPTLESRPNRKEVRHEIQWCSTPEGVSAISRG
jgi:hypothetical protein